MEHVSSEAEGASHTIGRSELGPVAVISQIGILVAVSEEEVLVGPLARHQVAVQL